MRAIVLGFASFGIAITLTTGALCEPFDEKDLAQAFELSKTCSKECSNESLNMVRLPLPAGKVGFLLTTNDMMFCGSGGCSSLVVVVTGNKFVKIKEDQGITKNQAIALASGEGDPKSLAGGKPSFDCSKATSASARLICGDAELANADRMLGAKFRTATSKDEATKKQLIEQQVIWLRERNRRCGVGPDKAAVPLAQLMPAKPCMLSWISIRIGELEGAPQQAQRAAAQQAPPVVAQRLESPEWPGGPIAPFGVSNLTPKTPEDAIIVNQMIKTLSSQSMLGFNCGQLRYLGGEVSDRSIEGLVGVFIVKLFIQNNSGNLIDRNSEASRTCGKFDHDVLVGQKALASMKGLYRKYESGWKLENLIFN